MAVHRLDPALRKANRKSMKSRQIIMNQTLSLIAAGVRRGETGKAWRGIDVSAKGNHWRTTVGKLDELDSKGDIFWPENGGFPRLKQYFDNAKGNPIQDIWLDIPAINSQAKDRTGYPTQKPVDLISRIISASSLPGDLVFDFFVGSGTTAVAANRIGRQYIGADINLGAIQTATKRLLGEDLSRRSDDPFDQPKAGFEVYNVNNYDFFRNPTQARDILLEALEVQPFEHSSIFDGEKDGRMVKIMPVNRIATKADLAELVSNFDQKLFQRRHEEKPNQPVEKILLVCMGHEPDLKAELELQAKPFKIDVEVVDILRDKSQLEFKRDSEAKLMIRNSELIIENFYPMNLLQKLSLQQEQVGEWRELVDSVMVDWNFDGAVLQPAVVDVPEGDNLVSGRYKVPTDAGTIRVKITDLLSENWEGNIDG
jgi:site-specific DNA-methyltransferase (adenine-specific)/adenine-specific DNA-methyltransferase